MSRFSFRIVPGLAIVLTALGLVHAANAAAVGGPQGGLKSTLQLVGAANAAATGSLTIDCGGAGGGDAVQRLAAEVRDKGWIAFGARSEKGDWDLFLCRPDGSQRRQITATPEFSEFSPQFSRDGRRLLYRRVPRSEKLDNNQHGMQGELVLANSDGSEPQVFGRPGEYTWASWSPDGKQIACLSIKGFSFVEVASRQTVRTLPRKGFFQQVTWSPDGKWLCGVANSFGTGWSIARMDAATGAAEAVNRVNCCTPDWFPDSQRLVLSWRPDDQRTNKGYGWTQLWMADADGKSRQLVYGEDGRHVYGGHVSPDGRYVLFTGNMNENGDPGSAGAPMGLMRLKDAPIIGGESKALRALHPDTKDGPVLTLPVGWEPCWTFSERPVGGPAAAGPPLPAAQANPAVLQTVVPRADDAVARLVSELRERGWIAYSARTERGDCDLFLIRPDGSGHRNLTQTHDFNEAGARFSPDGKRLLFYRMPRSEAVDNNTYGTFDLVIANADGSQPVEYGRGFPWASWGLGGSQLACLTPQGIRIVDVATSQTIRQWPRKGLISQLGWSPDGKWFVGTANGLGPFWSIGRLSAETGEINAVSETDRYNCTPDWVPDSQRVVYARGIVPNVGGRAELWVASGDGRERQMLYAEEGRHIYGACPSPDARYLLFTRSVEDLGKVDNSHTTMAVIRWADTPMLGDRHEGLRQRLPNAQNGPRLDLGPGWEPSWTYARLAVSVQGSSQ
jgi:Tol biopolymer transport system component